MFDVDKFRLTFKEFDCEDITAIQSAFDIACALRGDYCYVCSEKTRELMIMLSTAHELSLESNPALMGGQIRRVKNKADEIEYAVGKIDDPFGLNVTVYGARLQKLQRVYGRITGFIASRRSAYSPDIGSYYDDCHYY